jgi:hypothetical protein
MKSAFRKTTAMWAAAALAVALLAGCSGRNQSAEPSPSATSGEEATAAPSASPSPSANPGAVVYEDTQYGFTFALPEDWEGYTIISSEWEGLSTAEGSGDKVVETGPTLSIRDPRWTEENKRQDIPIMIFTLGQWDTLQEGEFHIGAAPMGPSELGRNDQYVFALPARYNFAFPEGYEEVETILEGNPLQPTDISK